MSARKPKFPQFKPRQKVLITAYIGPSGVTDDDGIFVNVNADDPEVWVHGCDVRPWEPVRESGAGKKGRGR